MPRSRRLPPPRPEGEASFDRLLAGWKRTEVRRGVEWTVQPVSAVQAQKAYVCPGCGRSVDPGTAQLCAWRAYGILGEAAALADRRHWHTPCWRIA
ncbi:hypothetical protein [Microbacterium sp. LEMMJ01]|uniref:hypothetical protein n=1 Tax=Microbacterium sp. LEMMJ01 TaxID=1978350 RepID=UPI000A1DA755|nr:hypothetical protein [Microbacterium sp. LEMMJ01]OSO97891.1 hypothetical protein B7W94_14905 [Microbacterium sp. LEMMJ01]